MSQVIEDVRKVLDDVYDELYNKALVERGKPLVPKDEEELFSPLLNKGMMVLIPFCGDPKYEDMVKKNERGTIKNKGDGWLENGSK